VVGGGPPPHWLGDSMDVNLATATAMERAAIRHLKRRQLEIADMVIDLCYVAYTRAHGLGMARRAPDRSAITIALPDLSRDDNMMLAQAGGEMVAAFNGLSAALGTGSRTLRERTLRLFSQFIAEPMDAREIQTILDELEAARPVVAPAPVEDEEDDGDEMSAIGRIWRNGNGR